MEEIRGGPVGPFEDLEVIRVGAGMPTARFCTLIGVPERTYRRWQAKAKRDRPPKGPWPQPARDAARELATGHALDHPAWGHRKVWAMIRHDGHRVSQATVLRLLRDDGLILPAEYQKQRRELAADRKAAFAQSLITKLDKLERIEVEDEDLRKMLVKFPPAPTSGKLVCEVRGVSKSYGEKLLFQNISIGIDEGQKVALIAGNVTG